MFKRQTLARIVVVATTIGSMAGLSILSPATGLAASKALAAAGSSAPAAHMINLTPALTCSYANGKRVRSASWVNGNETRIVYLWYSQSTACVWAVEVNGQPGDEVWVYNKDTTAKATTYIVSGQSSATTGEIGDSGTKSRACMIPHLANGSTGPKTCTTPDY